MVRRCFSAKTIAIVLALCTVFSVAALCLHSDSDVSARMDAYMATVYGKSLGGNGYTYYKNGCAMASGCHAFVNALWKGAFGYDTYDSVCYTTARSTNTAAIGAYIRANASVGDILRFDGSSRSGTHSMVIRSIGENGITTYEYGGPRHWFSEGPLSESYSYAYLASYYGGSSYFLYKSSASPAPQPVHTHEYVTGTQSAHPHAIYRYCSCGDLQYTGEYADAPACKVCHPVAEPAPAAAPAPAQVNASDAVAAAEPEESADTFVPKYSWTAEGTSLPYDKWMCKVVSNDLSGKIELLNAAEASLPAPVTDKVTPAKAELADNVSKTPAAPTPSDTIRATADAVGAGLIAK